MIGRSSRQGRADAMVIALALAMATLAASCNGSSDQALWRDDFESLCEGTPCGWTQVAGSAGSVTWIETLPSEHGVRMSGAGVAIARHVDDASVFQPASVSSLQGHVVARCDSRAQLTLIVTVQNAAGGPPIDVSGRTSIPAEWDGTRTIFDLVPNDLTNASAQFIELRDVVLHKEGPGNCEVDYVSLADENVPFAE